MSEEEIINAYDHADTHYAAERQRGGTKERQRTFEAYVYDFITKNNQKTLEAARNEGPDFVIDNGDHKINIEAVAPEFRNPIARDDDCFESGFLDPDKDLERWSTGIYDKTTKFKTYLDEKKLITPNDINIIAISNITNGSSLSAKCIATGYPLICQYLFEINFNEIEITQKTGERQFTSRASFKKTNGSKVETNIFLQDKNSHISAIMLLDYHNKEWTMIHNPLAKKHLNKDYFHSVNHISYSCSGNTCSLKRDKNYN